MFFNRKNGGSGSLYNRVRKLRNDRNGVGVNKDSDTQSDVNETAHTDNFDQSQINVVSNIVQSVGELSISDETVGDSRERILLKLKSSVLTSTNIDEIQKDLRLTFELRKQLLANQKTDLQERFPLLFAHPILVMRILNEFVFKIYIFIYYFIFVF